MVIPDILSLREIYIMARRNMKKKSNRPRRRQLRRRSKPQQTSGTIKTKQYARVVEVVPFTQPTANTDVNYQFNISQFSRAAAVAKNFKFYRAKRVVWTMLPEFNVFQAGSAAQSMTQISMIMNRTGDSTQWTEVEYDAQGAVPRTFAKKRVVAYKPNLTQPFNVTLSALSPDNPPLATTGTLGNTPVYDKWVGTGSYNINNTLGGASELVIRGDKTPYYGHSIYWNVGQVAQGAEIPLATIFCEVEWEFKDPLFEATQSLLANVAQPLTQDERTA